MTGLEKIIKEIRDEAAAEATQTVDKAKAEAKEILAAAKAESDAKVAQIEASATQQAADIEQSRDSALVLQRRQQTLSAKQEVLAETLQKALNSLYNLPEGEYFDLVVKLACKSAANGEGEMMLNKNDLARLPSGFEKKLAGALPSGSSLKIAKEACPIDGGFVLRYGDVEENCSFEAMFNARADEFSDLVRGTLFGA